MSLDEELGLKEQCQHNVMDDAETTYPAGLVEAMLEDTLNAVALLGSVGGHGVGSLWNKH